MRTIKRIIGSTVVLVLWHLYRWFRITDDGLEEWAESWAQGPR